MPSFFFFCFLVCHPSVYLTFTCLCLSVSLQCFLVLLLSIHVSKCSRHYFINLKHWTKYSNPRLHFLIRTSGMLKISHASLYTQSCVIGMTDQMILSSQEESSWVWKKNLTQDLLTSFFQSSQSYLTVFLSRSLEFEPYCIQQLKFLTQVRTEPSPSVVKDHELWLKRQGKS